MRQQMVLAFQVVTVTYEEESAFAVGGSYRMDAFAVRFAYAQAADSQGFSAGLQWEI